MHEATLVYPHQLFKTSSALAAAKAGDWPVYLIEEPLLLTHNPIHIQKLILHKLSLDAYEHYLTTEGYKTIRLTISKHPTTADMFAHIQKDGVTTIHVADTTDDYLERALRAASLERVSYESPLFLLPKEEAMERFISSKHHMASFYKALRKDKNILLEKDGEPVGGQWSFDADNRQKVPKNTPLPNGIKTYSDTKIEEAKTWAQSINAEVYGEPGCWLPYTHEGAEQYLQEFLEYRFADFGPYEDAMVSKHTRLWHSALSPLINLGLLTPEYVLNEALAYAKTHTIPINSLEGFVRQLLGWREFMRASYECDGSSMRTQNYFDHQRTLPDSFWNGTTNIMPVDSSISRALQFGYTHHIERLMVLGNFMLLTEIHPDEVYRWFMAMYIDAYDWVMVPNVYGMSQFADGGSFATKPYISGANYIKKMSDYPTGDWEETWTALYWNFITTHQDTFTKNHRMSMMPRLLNKMPPEKREHYLQTAQAYFSA